MKKHMPKSELEDVLSSIRTLVSEDTPGSAADGTPAEPKLVLTPQQRIGEEDAQAETGEARNEPMLLDNPLILPDGDLEAGGPPPDSVTAEGATAADTGSDARDAHAVDDGAEGTEASDASLETIAGDTWDNGTSSTRAEFFRSSSTSSETPSVVQHEAEQDLPQEAAVIRPEESADDSEAAMTAAALHALHGHDTPADIEGGRAAHELEDKIAELEAMISQVEDRQDAVLQRAGSDTTAEAWPERGPLGGSELDEEALRSLIADVVREELQGALGERFTRNVRKLVRREIQRALTVQDSS